MNNLIQTDYFRLFVKRESKVVLGNKWVNLWLLTIVFVATFFAIAFSEGSMRYLSEKMNDPFTNWVNIENDYNNGNFGALAESLEDENVAKHYQFKNFQSDYRFGIMFFHRDGENCYSLSCRFFERFDTDLFRAIVSDENIVENCRVNQEQIKDINRSLGVVISADALQRMGYSLDSIPAYINFSSYSKGADEFGFKLIEGKYALAPVPVLAVVRRLPTNKDLIATKYFFEQYLNSRTFPFNLNNRDYAIALDYFVPSTINLNMFKDSLSSYIPQEYQKDFNQRPLDLDEMQSYIDGSFVSLYSNRDSIPYTVFTEINDKVLTAFCGKGVYRVFNYNHTPYKLNEQAFISVNFAKLDSIRAFEQFAKKKFKVEIEMSQVTAKENFNAVSIMANILSWAMIIFSLTCIIMFIVNLLQSYFQKVKRNIGTFKAFGIANAELISIYIFIILSMVCAAIFVSLISVYLIQIVLSAASCLKDGQYEYLLLWSGKTFMAIGIIVIISIITVIIVMRRLLKSTPGDLIYDR